MCVTVCDDCIIDENPRLPDWVDAPQDDVQKMSTVIDLGTAVCVCMICMHHTH